MSSILSLAPYSYLAFCTGYLNNQQYDLVSFVSMVELISPRVVIESVYVYYRITMTFIILVIVWSLLVLGSSIILKIIEIDPIAFKTQHCIFYIILFYYFWGRGEVCNSLDLMWGWIILFQNVILIFYFLILRLCTFLGLGCWSWLMISFSGLS